MKRKSKHTGTGKVASRRSSWCSPCFLIPRHPFLPRCELTAPHIGLIQVLTGSSCQLAHSSDLVQDHQGTVAAVQNFMWGPVSTPVLRTTCGKNIYWDTAHDAQPCSTVIYSKKISQGIVHFRWTRRMVERHRRMCSRVALPWLHKLQDSYISRWYVLVFLT